MDQQYRLRDDLSQLCSYKIPFLKCVDTTLIGACGTYGDYRKRELDKRKINPRPSHCHLARLRSIVYAHQGGNNRNECGWYKANCAADCLPDRGLGTRKLASNSATHNNALYDKNDER